MHVQQSFAKNNICCRAVPGHLDLYCRLDGVSLCRLSSQRALLAVKGNRCSSRPSSLSSVFNMCSSLLSPGASHLWSFPARGLHSSMIVALMIKCCPTGPNAYGLTAVRCPSIGGRLSKA
eukprot:3001410-Karenia_brevis.AAC.1